MQNAVNVLGAPGKPNGVNVSFASEKAISAHAGGHSANGYTEQKKDGSVHVTLRSDFGSLYSNYPKQAFGRDFSRLSARDERAGIVAHEGEHVFQFRNGLTQQAYNRNPRPYENDAYGTQKLVNKAYGSESVYDSEK